MRLGLPRLLHGRRRSYSLRADLGSLADYLALRKDNPEYFSEQCERTILEHVHRRGVHSAFLGAIPADRVELIGDEPREHLMCDGLNVRVRAVLDTIQEYAAERSLGDLDLKIYAHEAITRMALVLRARFPKFIGTEFCSTEEERRSLFPIRHGDAAHTEFPDDAFHLLVSCDVLEHVPDLDACLREGARILRTGGRLIATFPFLWDRPAGVRTATPKPDGTIEHHVAPPIYHGNPMDPARGSLVFELPAWDVLERAHRAGFSRAVMRFLCDQDRGIVTASPGQESSPKGVFLAIFDKGASAPRPA